MAEAINKCNENGIVCVMSMKLLSETSMAIMWLIRK
jgi:hypothetical protein